MTVQVEALTYEALKAKCDHLEQINAQTLQVKLTMAETIKEQTDRVNALAVENAALKTAHPQPFGREMMKALDAYEKHQDEVPETGMLDAFFILRDSIRVETPATSAALAAIQAQGVEKFADFLDSPIDGQHCYQNEVGLARHFASTLREAK